MVLLDYTGHRACKEYKKKAGQYGVAVHVLTPTLRPLEPELYAHSM
jgi:hypothetical protein